MYINLWKLIAVSGPGVGGGLGCVKEDLLIKHISYTQELTEGSHCYSKPATLTQQVGI